MAMFTREQLYTHNGIRKVRTLFREYATNPQQHADAIFCLNRYDRDGLVSLYRLYMELAIDDPTEHTFAIEVFGEYQFWEWIRDRTPVKEMINDWEREAEVARKSKLVKKILEATKDDKTKFQSSKYLLEKGIELRPGNDSQDKRKLRKENKDQIEEALTSAAFKDDIKRLQLSFDDTKAN